MCVATLTHNLGNYFQTTVKNLIHSKANLKVNPSSYERSPAETMKTKEL